MDATLVDALDWGTSLDSRVVTYAFYTEDTLIELDEDGDGHLRPHTTVGWNDYEKQQARLAFDSFARLTELTFVEVGSTEEATLRLALYPFEDLHMLGWAVPPGERVYGQPEGFVAFNIASSMWSREVGGNLDVGGYGFITLTHEFGHLLGLAHPHDEGGGSSPLLPGVIRDPDYSPQGTLGFYELNQGVYTMMSYRDGWPAGPLPEGDRMTPHDWATGPMALDIAILQRKYGINSDNGQAATLYDLLDSPIPGYGYTTIWNPAGGHTIRYQGEYDAVINLQSASLEAEWGGAGWMSFVKGVTGGYTIAHGTEVVNAISGSGDDALFGNALDNVFDPGDGDNMLHGNGGADVVLYDGSVFDYEFAFGRYAGSKYGIVQAADESRSDALFDIRRLDFDEGQVVIEAVAEESLAIGALYLAMLDRLPEADGYAYWTSVALKDTPLDSISSLFAGSDEFASGLGAVNDDDYVDRMYDILLGRDADEAGAAYWTSKLVDGMDRGTLALHFITADEQSESYRVAVMEEVITFGDLWA